jgi:hypothetical protein
MSTTTAGARLSPDSPPPRRNGDLTRLVALMAAHRDSLATPDGDPVPLEQRQIDSIVARLTAEPRRRVQAGQH